MWRIKEEVIGENEDMTGALGNNSVGAMYDIKDVGCDDTTR